MSVNHDLIATRASGAGNTFFIIDFLSPNHSPFIAEDSRALFSEHICRDLTGMATDGVVFLVPDDHLDFAWDFYNADGSSGEMCGNAARCVALYYYNKISKKNKIKWRVQEKTIEAKIIDAVAGIVQVRMPQPIQIKNPCAATAAGKKIRGYFVNTGVPHFVIQDPPDAALARQLRQAKEFQPAGANITFVDINETEIVQAVTFERGVEDFTLACGTGAVAAALFHHEQHPNIKTQVVEMPGGILTIDWDEGVPLMTGPVEFQFDGKFYPGLI